MKKFLLITYYWPPAGGAGVMRWLKMTKYFRQYGWQPVVFTPSGGEVPVNDESLLNEVPPDVIVVKLPIWEPYSVYKRLTGKKSSDRQYSGFIQEKGKVTFAQKVSIFIRGNFFIPDARMFWIRPAVRFLKEYLRENPVEAIVTTGPPHSMHMIGHAINKATGIPWIADFRDPWTNMGFYNELRLTKWGDARHRRMEKKVLSQATKVVAVTWRSRDEFKEIVHRDDIAVITNGYDDADFTSGPQSLDKEFSILYIGSLNKPRNPSGFWKALSEVVMESADLREVLRLKMYGPMDAAIRESIDEAGLTPYTDFKSFVPHNQAVRMQSSAQLLLLIMINTPDEKTVIPGKLFEYLGSGRPVLSICPKDSDTAKVIELTEGGYIHEAGDIEGMKARILELFEYYKKGELVSTAKGTERFTRRHLAGEYARLLDEVTKIV